MLFQAFHAEQIDFDLYTYLFLNLVSNLRYVNKVTSANTVCKYVLKWLIIEIIFSRKPDIELNLKGATKMGQRKENPSKSRKHNRTENWVSKAYNESNQYYN